MSRFWPDDVELSDLSTPYDIVMEAKQEWLDNTNGLLSILVEEATTSNDHDMLIVRAENTESKRAASLFKIVFLPGQPYPASIFPRDDKELPNFLKKRYFKEPSLTASARMFREISGTTEGKWVETEWVCETPAEFREKLAEVCNLGITKREIFALLSLPETESSSTDESDNPPNKRKGAKKTTVKAKRNPKAKSQSKPKAKTKTERGKKTAPRSTAKKKGT